jgi:hypothetical protein
VNLARVQEFELEPTYKAIESKENMIEVSQESSEPRGSVTRQVLKILFFLSLFVTMFGVALLFHELGLDPISDESTNGTNQTDGTLYFIY